MILRRSDVDDLLDAALDRDGERLPRELEPLAQAAAMLRDELATLAPDPATAREHVAMALDASTVRRHPAGRRRLTRLVVGAAAVLTALITPTAASAGSLPGEPLYPVKRAYEEVRVATVRWFPAVKARECTRIASVRLEELNEIVEEGQAEKIPEAIEELDSAVDEASEAVVEAAQEVQPPEAAELMVELEEVKAAQMAQLAAVMLQPPAANSQERAEILEAAEQSLQDAGDDPVAPSAVVPTTSTVPQQVPSPTTVPPPTTAVPPPPTTRAPEGNPTTTAAPTTTVPPTTSAPPPVTEGTAGDEQGGTQGTESTGG